MNISIDCIKITTIVNVSSFNIGVVFTCNNKNVTVTEAPTGSAASSIQGTGSALPLTTYPGGGPVPIASTVADSGSLPSGTPFPSGTVEIPQTPVPQAVTSPR